MWDIKWKEDLEHKRESLWKGGNLPRKPTQNKRSFEKNKIKLDNYSFYCVSFAFLVRSFPLNRANDILDFPRDLCTTPPTTMTYHD